MHLITSIFAPTYASIDPQVPFNRVQYLRDNRYRVIMLQVKGPGMRGADPALKQSALSACDNRMRDIYSALSEQRFKPRELPQSLQAYGEIILELAPLVDARDPLADARLTVKIPTKKFEQTINASALSPGRDAVNLIIAELWPLGDDPPRKKP